MRITTTFNLGNKSILRKYMCIDRNAHFKQYNFSQSGT